MWPHFQCCVLFCVSGDSRVRPSAPTGAARPDDLPGWLRWLLPPFWRQEVRGQGFQVVSPHPLIWFLHSGAQSTRKTEDWTPEGTRWVLFLFFLYLTEMWSRIKTVWIQTHSQWSHFVSPRPETRAALRPSESWRASNSGGRACRSAQWGVRRNHSWEKSLHFRGLQLSSRGRAAEIVQWSGRSGSRGHPRERAPRESGGPRTQHAWNGGGSGSGLLRAEAGAVPLQSEVQTLLPAERRGRRRRLGA